MDEIVPTAEIVPSEITVKKMKHGSWIAVIPQALLVKAGVSIEEAKGSGRDATGNIAPITLVFDGIKKK